MLAACPRKAILARMLRNLKAIYVKADDYPRALRTIDLLLTLDPDSAEDRRDRGLLHAAFDCYALAAADLEAYLALAPAAPEAKAVMVEDHPDADVGGAPQLRPGGRAMSTARTMETSTIKSIEDALGKDARALLEHRCRGISRDALHLPGPDFVDRVHSASDRPVPVLRSLQQLLSHGRLAGTGYVSILPVDQGIEHSAGASFAKNPAYFDPENIVKLAIEGGCNAVASTLGRAGIGGPQVRAPDPVHLKINHNEFLTYPNKFDQIIFARVKQAADMGAVAVGATIYFGSAESARQIEEVGEAFQRAHELGMATVLWCYLRNTAFKTRRTTTTSPPTSPARPTTWA